MRAFHAICGLPRAGSTLASNILAQNPAFSVLHTSPLPMLLDHFANGATDAPEIKGMLARDVAGTDQRIWDTARAMMEAFSDTSGVAFDKNRLWNVHQFTLAKLYPRAKLIVCVRNLCAIFGSTEKQWRRNPLLRVPPGLTMRARMENQFSRDGLIGSSLTGIEDLLLADNPNVFWMAYEALTQNPGMVMQRLYDFLGEPFFEHDFERIKNTAVDPDWLYLGKFPHEGKGKVKPREDWQQFVPQQLAGEIANNHAAYMQRFGYVS